MTARAAACKALTRPYAPELWPPGPWNSTRRFPDCWAKAGVAAATTAMMNASERMRCFMIDAPLIRKHLSNDFARTRTDRSNCGRHDGAVRGVKSRHDQRRR